MDVDEGDSEFGQQQSQSTTDETNTSKGGKAVAAAGRTSAMTKMRISRADANRVGPHIG